MTAPPQDELLPALNQLRQFLAWLVPIALGFAILELGLVFVIPTVKLVFAVGITSGYLCCLVIAQYFIRQDKLYLAVNFICGGLLGAAPAIILVWPSLLPAVGMLPILVVAIALPYFTGQMLRRLILACIGVSLIVVFLSQREAPFVTTPSWLTTLLQITTLMAITILIIQLLGQFRQQLSQTLNQMHIAQHHLKAQHERLAVTLQQIGDGVITIDTHGNIETFNPAMERLTGWQESEAIGKPFADVVVLVDEISHTTLDGPIPRAQAISLQPQGISQAMIVARDGTRCAISGSVVPLYQTPADLIGAVVAFHDVSAQKRISEERLVWERKILESQKLESLGVLTGGIAHDFNNILVSVLGNASLARDEVEEGSPLFTTITQIEVAATRAAELTRQMLAYSGRGRFLIQAVDINHLVTDITALLRATIGKNIRLAFDYALDLPLVEADITQLRQVVMNVIMNAAESIGAQSGEIRVTTRSDSIRQNIYQAGETTFYDFSTDQTNTYAICEVQDTGSGMDLSTMTRIFEPFFTTKFTGRGLGLSAVLGIIRSHKGFISIQSQIGSGTTIAIAFPSSETTLIQVRAAQLSDQNLIIDGTVLLAEDEKEVREVTREMLQRNGLTVLIAANGQEAIDIYTARQETIDYVLLDLTMPVLSGIEAYRSIRQLNPQAQIVLMSGYSAQEVIQRVEDSTTATFLQKPFTTIELIRSIQEARGKKKFLI